MGKEKPRSHELERYSRGMLQARLSEWVVNSLEEEDYAFDFEVRPTGSFVDHREVRQSPFFVQLKASDRFSDEETVSLDVETSYLLDDCLGASIPVVLVLYDRDRDEFSWCVLQSYCWDVLDRTQEGWRDQSTVRVTVDRDPLADTHGKVRLANAVERGQRRITMRASIATMRRGSFAHPPGTTLATTDDVHAHKQEIVDTAATLAMAGYEDQALIRLMRVYQMPETDEPTLEAIRYLLLLRTTTEPPITFAKIRLASHGAELSATYGRDDLVDEFARECAAAWDYVEEQFIGARYLNHYSYDDLLVLEVENWGSDSWADALWMAILQDTVGHITDAPAAGLHRDPYELLESGESRRPRLDACAEGDHEFDPDDLRELPSAARCGHCQLAHGVIRNWLNHDVPQRCEICEAVIYDAELRRDRWYCPDCVPS